MLTLNGSFSALPLAQGVWVLTGGLQDEHEVYLQGANADAAAVLHGKLTGLEIEWRRDGVRVAVTGSRGVRSLTAASVIIHEPAPRLYEHLPLANFGADARRFWKRIFRLMRIPGGRLLLGMVRRSRRTGRRRGT